MSLDKLMCALLLFDTFYRKILVVTGKGLRSKTYDDPYLSKVKCTKYFVLEYIKIIQT